MKMLLQRVTTPPIIGIFVGLSLGLSPGPIRASFRGGALSFVLQAMTFIGNAAIPLMMMLLGSHLQKGPRWESINKRALIGCIVSKLLIMPLCALFIVLGLVYSGVFFAPRMLILVTLMESAMPTANNLLVMSEMAGGRDSQVCTQQIMRHMFYTSRFFLT